MKLSIITYNLHFSKAMGQIEDIISTHKPDILCLQEMETSEENLHTLTQYGYNLADYSNSFIHFGQIYGLATFYRADIFTFIESDAFNLPRGMYEMLQFLLNGRQQPRTVLRTDFRIKNTRTTLTVYNLHLSPWATNSIRDKQLRKMFADVELFSKKNLIVVGDFNYPYGRKKFEAFIREFNLTEATNNLFYTLEQGFLKWFSVKLKLDYVLYRNITHIETTRLPLRLSDHFPICVTFEL